MLDALFNKVLLEYQDEKKKAFEASPFLEILTEKIPTFLSDRLANDDKYKIYGSFGTGGWSEAPWVAVLNKNITESTQSGYYVVFLLNAKKKLLYLSLAVGWKQFADNFPAQDAREKIREYSSYVYEHIGNIPPKFVSGPIDLDATTNRAKGYEIGQIVSKAYSLNEISDSALLSDFDMLMSTYDGLADLAGNGIVNVDPLKFITGEGTDRNERNLNKITLIRDPNEAMEALRKFVNDQPPAIREIVVKKIARNPGLAKKIKEKQGFICEICKLEPFIQKNGGPYAEADHINPLGGQTNGLDSPENMRCLCAQCHAIITHGSDGEIKKLLAKNKISDRNFSN